MCVCVFQYTTYFCSALMSLVCVCERVLGVRMEYKGSGRSYQPLFNISHYHMCAYFSRTSPHTFLYLSLSRVRLPLLIYVSHITRCIAHALITSDNEECHLRWVKHTYEAKCGLVGYCTIKKGYFRTVRNELPNSKPLHLLKFQSWQKEILEFLASFPVLQSTRR